jgi:hypothetical protein
MSKVAGRRELSSWVARYPRRRALLGVAFGLAVFVVVNTLVRAPAGQVAAGVFVGPPPLPVVQMSRPGAWRCPGPLPVGVGKERSRISIVNNGTSAVSLVVVVSRTGLPRVGTSSGSSISMTRVEVGGESQAVLALTTRGPAGFAAVSIETGGGGIGVGESIVGGSVFGDQVVLSSPCTLAAGAQGYLPTGSTYGDSDVQLSLYDPGAAAAVVNVSVSTGTALTSPPAFQGVVVPATGLVVLDLRRWVFQQSPLAVTATAVSGDVVVGALESTSETVTIAPRATAGHGVTHLRVTGSSLLVGPDRGLGRWAFPALQSPRGVASTFSVYNPGKQPVVVSAAPPGRAGIVAALTEDVPAGGIVDFATPVTGRSGFGTGSVVVSAQTGKPIVVARLTTRYSTRSLEAIDATPGTAGPHDEWLLPGASRTSQVKDVVTLDDPGPDGATVEIFELTSGGGTPALLEEVSLHAGSDVGINLGLVLKYAPSFALRVVASAPILVEQQLTPRGGLTTAAGGIPVRP